MTATKLIWKQVFLKRYQALEGDTWAILTERVGIPIAYIDSALTLSPYQILRKLPQNVDYTLRDGDHLFQGDIVYIPEIPIQRVTKDYVRGIAFWVQVATEDTPPPVIGDWFEQNLPYFKDLIPQIPLDPITLAVYAVTGNTFSLANKILNPTLDRTKDEESFRKRFAEDLYLGMAYLGAFTNDPMTFAEFSLLLGTLSLKELAQEAQEVGDAVAEKFHTTATLGNMPPGQKDKNAKIPDYQGIDRLIQELRGQDVPVTGNRSEVVDRLLGLSAQGVSLEEATLLIEDYFAIKHWQPHLELGLLKHLNDAIQQMPSTVVGLSSSTVKTAFQTYHTKMTERYKLLEKSLQRVETHEKSRELEEIRKQLGLPGWAEFLLGIFFEPIDIYFTLRDFALDKDPAILFGLLPIIPGAITRGLAKIGKSVLKRVQRGADWVQKTGKLALSRLKQIGSARNLPPRQILFPNPRTVQHEYKHASDFGISGNWNSAQKAAFMNALTLFVQNAPYRKRGTFRGTQSVVHYWDNTYLWVATDLQGNFVAGWPLKPTQIKSLHNTGNVQ
jgi:hypothetical protein